MFNSSLALPHPRLPSGSSRWEIYHGLVWLKSICEAGKAPIVSPEVVVRTSLQHRLGGYRPELPLCGDQEMWMRFAVHTDIGFLPNTDQAFYRIHNQSMHLHQFSAFYKDVQQRIVAFDTIFREYRDLIPEWRQLYYMANRSLACDALWGVGQAFYDRNLAQTPVNELIKFATTSYGGKVYDLEHLRVYACASRRILQTLGSKLRLT